MKKLQFALSIILAIAICVGIGFYIYSIVMMNTKGNTHPEVSMELDGYGVVKFELYPEYAPNTVANFIKLVESGYYNDKVMYGKDNVCLYFGRNSEGEVDEPTTETIGYDAIEEYKYSIAGEFVANGFSQNTLNHEKGVISLIRSNFNTDYFPSLYEESYNSGNSQIGIMMSDTSANLNGVYAAFGRVIEGMDILEKIYNENKVVITSSTTSEDTEETVEEVATVENTDTDEINATLEPAEEVEEEDDGTIKEFLEYPKIKEDGIILDTHGIDYGMPKIQKLFDYEEYVNNYYSQYYSQQ